MNHLCCGTVRHYINVGSEHFLGTHGLVLPHKVHFKYKINASLQSYAQEHSSLLGGFTASLLPFFYHSHLVQALSSKLSLSFSISLPSRSPPSASLSHTNSKMYSLTTNTKTRTHACTHTERHSYVVELIRDQAAAASYLMCFVMY